MSPKNKLANRDRSIRHAFRYINILKTDLGLTFSEIAKQLNAENYRTRDGRKYTVDQVSQVWESGKIKYRLEYVNHKKPLVPRSLLEIKNEVLNGPISSVNTKSALANVQNSLLNMIDKSALNEVAKELNVKLPLNPRIDTNFSKHKLIKSLIKVILAYDINPKEFTDETLNVLGSLLFHPDFKKARKL